MGHSRRLLAFKVMNTAFDHKVNNLGALDVTVGEFYAGTICRPPERGYKYGGLRVGVGLLLVAFSSQKR